MYQSAEWSLLTVNWSLLHGDELKGDESNEPPFTKPCEKRKSAPYSHCHGNRWETSQIFVRRWDALISVDSLLIDSRSSEWMRSFSLLLRRKESEERSIACVPLLGVCLVWKNCIHRTSYLFYFPTPPQKMLKDSNSSLSLPCCEEYRLSPSWRKENSHSFPNHCLIMQVLTRKKSPTAHWVFLNETLKRKRRGLQGTLPIFLQHTFTLPSFSSWENMPTIEDKRERGRKRLRASRTVPSPPSPLNFPSL